MSARTEVCTKCYRNKDDPVSSSARVSEAFKKKGPRKKAFYQGQQGVQSKDV